MMRLSSPFSRPILALATMGALAIGLAACSARRHADSAPAASARPAQTLESYRQALDHGATQIEASFVLTRDGELVARPGPVLDDSTDVAEKFPASRRVTRWLDGQLRTGYFAGDFTLAEIRTLRAVGPRDAQGQSSGRDDAAIPSLAEVLALASLRSRDEGPTISVVPEIQDPAFHASLLGRQVFEDRLLTQLHAAFGQGRAAPVVIVCAKFPICNE